MITTSELRAVQRDGAWLLAGVAGHPDDLRLCNDYLGYLADRHYAAGTRRSYALDLLAFARWLAGQQLRLGAVDTGGLLRFLAWCRSDGLAAATVNRRMAALSGLFAFRSMRDPSQVNPMPKGTAARRATGSQRDGLLGHLGRPEPRSALRVRQPRRLPRGLDRAEVTAFLSSLRTWRDKAIAGLMPFFGLRSAEVLALTVADVDIAQGWARVAGKGGRERRAPVDAEVAGWIQTYLLVERPGTDTGALFVVAKGRNRGQPLTPAGLRTIFRYHRAKTGVVRPGKSGGCYGCEPPPSLPGGLFIHHNSGFVGSETLTAGTTESFPQFHRRR